MKRGRSLAMVAAATLALAACGSPGSMPSDEVDACHTASAAEGSLGGSSQIVSSLVLRLPDEAFSPVGTPAEETEATFDEAFADAYGITVDEFLALRDDADAATAAEIGDPPAVGELVSDDWFRHRDGVLLGLWNQRYPASARDYCASLSP
jgi:hypothetical protein